MVARRPFGFNVIGQVTPNTGLGVLTRHLATLILSRGHPLSVFDLPTTMARHDTTLEQYAVRSAGDLPYAVNLFVLPPQMFSESVAFHPKHRQMLLQDGILNAALPMWEHLTVPRVWRRALEILDVIVATTSFVRASFDADVDGVLTISGACPLYLPASVESARERFRLPRDAVLFATSFELYSPKRKNILAVVKAFRRAFPDSARAGLVIKVNNADRGQGALAELRAFCGDDRRIYLIDAALSYQDVLSLYASCDVYVSLHRSEGLGLALMEAMALGKPVIATAWSGNMSYMDPSNACLVGFRIIRAVAETRSCTRMLGPSERWADPDLEDAAAWMRRLTDSPELRAAIGHRARAAMARYQEHASRGDFLDALATIHANLPDIPSLRRKHEPGFQAEWIRACERAANTLDARVRQLLARHVLWRFRRRRR